MKNVDNSNLDNNVGFNEPEIKLDNFPIQSKRYNNTKILNSCLLCVFASTKYTPKVKSWCKYGRNFGCVLAIYFLVMNWFLTDWQALPAFCWTGCCLFSIKINYKLTNDHNFSDSCKWLCLNLIKIQLLIVQLLTKSDPRHWGPAR